MRDPGIPLARRGRSRRRRTRPVRLERSDPSRSHARCTRCLYYQKCVFTTAAGVEECVGLGVPSRELQRAAWEELGASSPRAAGSSATARRSREASCTRASPSGGTTPARGLFAVAPIASGDEIFRIRPTTSCPRAKPCGATSANASAKTSRAPTTTPRVPPRPRPRRRARRGPGVSGGERVAADGDGWESFGDPPETSPAPPSVDAVADERVLGPRVPDERPLRDRRKSLVVLPVPRAPPRRGLRRRRESLARGDARDASRGDVPPGIRRASRGGREGRVRALRRPRAERRVRLPVICFSRPVSSASVFVPARARDGAQPVVPRGGGGASARENARLPRERPPSAETSSSASESLFAPRSSRWSTSRTTTGNLASARSRSTLDGRPRDGASGPRRATPCRYPTARGAPRISSLRYGFVVADNVEPDGSSNDVFPLKMPGWDRKDAVELRVAPDAKYTYPALAEAVTREMMKADEDAKARRGDEAKGTTRARRARAAAGPRRGPRRLPRGRGR